MIAEQLDSGVISVAAVGGLLLFVAGGAWWASAAWSLLKRIERDLSASLRSLRDLTRTVDDHRVEDDARHAEQGRRIDRLELVAELTPIHGVPVIDPRVPTGKHDRLRGDTPRPRKHADSGDTDSGLR